jgi:hypothetical protein
MDRLVNLIFSWERLRNAVTEEVHLYDDLGKRMAEYNPDHNSVFWYDWDGWRSRSFSPERNKYYFNDIAEMSLMNAMNYAFESVGPEFDIDEVW